MAFELSIKKIASWGAKATEALTVGRGVVIDFNARTASYPAAVGNLAHGVVVVNAASGEDVDVITDGFVPVKITTAASIVVGSLLMVDAAGGFVLATTGEVSIAQALVAPTADGQLILAKLTAPYTLA